jgi:hypothetical protein
MRSSLLLLTAVLVSAPVIAPAAAAPSPATNVTVPGDTPTATPSNQQTIQIDNTLTVTSWNASAGEIRITMESAVLTDITITDSMAIVDRLRRGGGARSMEIPRRTYDLDPGTNTIVFDATTVDGESAVTVGHTGDLVLLRSGSLQGTPDPVERRTAQWMIGAVAIGTVLSLGIVVVRRQRNDGEEVRKIV